jgi:hypothetical protein
MPTRASLLPVARLDLVVADAGRQWWVDWSGSFGVSDEAVPEILRVCARRLLDEARELEAERSAAADG